MDGFIIKETTAMKNRLEPNDRLLPNQSISSPDRQYFLIFQADGNLVVYHAVSGKVMWASNTAGKHATSLFMRMDGNLVLYDNVVPVWESGTAGKEGSYLEVQDGGSLAIKHPVNVWRSATMT